MRTSFPVYLVVDKRVLTIYRAPIRCREYVRTIGRVRSEGETCTDQNGANGTVRALNGLIGRKRAMCVLCLYCRLLCTANHFTGPPQDRAKESILTLTLNIEVAINTGLP